MTHQPVPSRPQLLKMAGGDYDLMKSLELLFRGVAGEIPSTELDNELTIGVALQKANAGEVQLVELNKRLKTNEVLLWLSM